MFDTSSKQQSTATMQAYYIRSNNMKITSNIPVIFKLNSIKVSSNVPFTLKGKK